MTRTWTALIVDDEDLARAVVREHLAGHPEIQVVGECANGFDAVKLASECRPDLLFLDIQPERYMTASDGAALLLEMEAAAGGSQLVSALGVGVARAGSEDAAVVADWLPKLAGRDLGGPLHILVVPAGLHFMEAEGLVALAGAPREILDEAEP